MSPIEIRPTTLPSSTTGRCRNLPIVIISMIAATVSDCLQLTTLRVITALTGSSSDAGAAFAEHAHDVALRQDAFDAALAHHQHGADLPLRQNLDRGRKFGVRLDALDVMAFGIEDCTYRHCRLPEVDRALRTSAIFVPLSLQSTVQRRFRCRRIRQTPASSTLTGLCPASQAAMMDEIAMRRKRRSAAIRKVVR